MQLQNDMGLKVWSSWVVVEQISKTPSRRGLQKNHAQLLLFNNVKKEFLVGNWKFLLKYCFIAVQKLAKRESGGLDSERAKQITKAKSSYQSSGEASTNHVSKPTSEPSKSLKRSQAIWATRAGKEANQPFSWPTNTNQQTSQPINQPTSRPTKQTTNQPPSQPTNRGADIPNCPQ